MASTPNPQPPPHSVTLPAITAGDDTTYWATLTDLQLNSHIHADLWNAAAGLHEQTRRSEQRRHQLAADIARFSTRPTRRAS